MMKGVIAIQKLNLTVELISVNLATVHVTLINDLDRIDIRLPLML